MLKTIELIFPNNFKALDFSDYFLKISTTVNTQKDNKVTIERPSYNDKKFLNAYFEYTDHNYRKGAESATYTIVD